MIQTTADNKIIAAKTSTIYVFSKIIDREENTFKLVLLQFPSENKHNVPIFFTDINIAAIMLPAAKAMMRNEEGDFCTVGMSFETFFNEVNEKRIDNLIIGMQTEKGLGFVSKTISEILIY